MLMIGVKPKSV